jgi:uncharacterized glyoxalase superfamily protein PhnB
MPMVTVPSVDETRAFYVDKLGFRHQMGVVGKDGQLDFCNVVYGKASLMFNRAQGPLPQPAEAQPVAFYIWTEDVDAHFAELREAGLRATEPLTDQWWGDRTFVISDPNGYRVWFYATVAEIAPPPGMKIV